MNQRNKFNIKSALKDKARRIFPLLIIPVLILSFFPISVDASTYYPIRPGQMYSYTECNPQAVDNTEGLAFFKFDIPMGSMQMEYSSPGYGYNKEIVSGGLDVAYLPLQSDTFNYWNFYLRVFRYQKQHLSLKNIPDGAILNFHTTVWVDFHGDVQDDPFERIWITYVDDNGETISSNSYDLNAYMHDLNYYSYSVDLPISKPAGTAGCFVSLMVGRLSVTEMYSTGRQEKVQVFNTQMSVRFDKSYLDYYQDQTIIDQNNTIINGTPGQNQQISDANDKMESAGDKLGDLNDQMQVEKPDAGDMDVSIDSLVPGTSILAYTQPILEFWENPTLKAMLIIVMTLVLVSWVMFGKKG